MKGVGRNFFIASIVAFLFFTCLSFYVMLPKFIKFLGGGRRDIGIIMGAPGFVSALLLPLAGILVEKAGRKRFAVIGTGGLALTSLLYLLVDSFNLPLFIFLRLLQGFFLSFSFVASSAFAGDSAPPYRRSEFLGYFGIFILSPNMIGPWFGEMLIRYSFKSLFLFSSLFGFLAFILSLKYREENPENLPRPEKKEEMVGQPVKFLFLLSFILGCAFSTTFFFLPAFSLEKGIESIGSFYTLYTFTAITVRLFLGRWAESVKFHTRVPAFFILISISLFILAHLSFHRALISAIIYGIGEGLAYPAISAEVLNRMPGRINRATGGYLGAFNIGTLLAPITFGYIAEAYGYRMVFFILAFFPLIGLVILFMDKRAGTIKFNGGR